VCMGSEHDLCYYCMHAPQQKLELACYGESLLESMSTGMPGHGDAPGGGVCCVRLQAASSIRGRVRSEKKGVLVIQRQRPFGRIRHGASCNKLQNSR